MEIPAGSLDPHRTDPRIASYPPARFALLAFGWANVALGLIGLVLPVLPTTVFLLIALWAFSKSSPRLHRWLFAHPRFGRSLRAWHAHRVIPLRAKLLAVGAMAGSLACVALFVARSWELPAALGALLAPIAAYILSRPSRIPLPDGGAEA